MSEFEFLFQSGAGVRHGWKEDADGTVTFASQQNVAPILEQNKAMANHNRGFTQSKDMARIASIPLAIIYKWMTEEGWDPFSQDPDCQKKLAQKLDSNEYRYLRTSELILGDSWRKVI